MKSHSLLVALVGSCVLLGGCTAAMNSDDIRFALNECQKSRLDNVVYLRPDRSVLNVACTPHPDEVDNSVTVKHPLLYSLSPGHEKPLLPFIIWRSSHD